MTKKNKTILQDFEWYLPNDSLQWKRVEHQGADLAAQGITDIWLPPAFKGNSGRSSVGYDIYDLYDLGEFNQKGTVATKYGTKEEYLAAVSALQSHGLNVLSDIVLNHMMGADETEPVTVIEDAPDNRNQAISKPIEISAWTVFNFPGRHGKYSDYTWNFYNFSGTDWDEAEKRSGIFRIFGKRWNRGTDTENGNFDYLMGADIDMDDASTVEQLTKWGKWYFDTVHPDGVRLDAVKHISYGFYKKWLKDLREYTGKDFFAVGEYWNADTGSLTTYLDNVDNSMSLFDVPLHFQFFNAANRGADYPMNTLKANTLCALRPDNAVTFVDNHDTQPGQALQSWVAGWFKPMAYAQILLQQEGIPCVFYGDLYGIPHDRIPAVPGLKTMIKVRNLCAYGKETDYYDDPHVVGFTRAGDEDHPDSGVAVLMTNADAGKKTMCLGEALAGRTMLNALYPDDEIVLDEHGCGTFPVRGGDVSVWVTKEAYRKLM